MKSLMTVALAVALAALLAGCAQTRALSPQESLLVACSGYDATLRTLAGYRAAGRLSDGDVATVDRYRPLLNANCLAEEPPAGPITSDLLDQIEGAMLELLRIQGSAAR